MDENYKKRELDHFFEDITERLERIETQTTATNGKVKKHEWNFKALWWGAGALLAVTGTLYSLLKPLIESKLRETINSSVKETLNEYDVVYLFDKKEIK